MPTVKTYPEEDGLWTIVAPLRVWQRKGFFMNADHEPDRIMRLIVWPEEVSPIMGQLHEAEAVQ